MITGQAIADTARNGGYIGIPYSKLDCQAFVERVLLDAGLPIINYRGSNHMWRELVYDRKLIEEARDILPGMLVFRVLYDGGETKRGYHDSMGNAVHVGIYIGNDDVIHSTTGGVQFDKLSRFTHIAYISDVDYTNIVSGEDEGGDVITIDGIIAQLKEILDELEAYRNGIDNK